MSFKNGPRLQRALREDEMRLTTSTGRLVGGWALAFAALVWSASAQAATAHTVQNGAWDAPSTWSGGVVPAPADGLTVAHWVTIPVGLTVTVSAGGFLYVEGNGQLLNGGTLDNSGLVVLRTVPTVNPLNPTNGGWSKSTGTVLNRGRFNVDETIFNNAGTFTNTSTGTLTLAAAVNQTSRFVNEVGGSLASEGTINIYAFLSNSGTVTTSGSFDMNNTGRLVNDGSFEVGVSGLLRSSGDLINSGTFVNRGLMRGVDSGLPSQLGVSTTGTFSNIGTLSIELKMEVGAGTLTNAAGALLTLDPGVLVNRALTDNYGAIATGTSTAAIANFGTLNEHCGATIGRLSSASNPVVLEQPCAVPDAGAEDAGTVDAGTVDAGADDAGTFDAGTDGAGTDDAGTGDPGTDGGASVMDAGSESTDAGAGVDAGTKSVADAGMSRGTADAGTDPMTAGGCSCSSLSAPFLWLGLVALAGLRRRNPARLT